MKIAVASADGVSISQHFGRSACFIVFEVKDGKITSRDVRENTYTAFARGKCEDGTTQHHDQPHSHAEVVSALRECGVVLCRGMGQRAAAELKANGIQPFVIDSACSPEDAVAAYLGGRLKIAGDFCRCHE